jgi:hypothetical protein
MSIRYNGVHYEGPILGSDNSGGGIFEDVSLGTVDEARGPFKAWRENFNQVLASGDIDTLGFTVTDGAGSAANTDVVTTAQPYLALNAGTAANTYQSAQFVAAKTATVLRPLEIMDTIDPVAAAAFDGREVFWFCRFGVSSNTTAWDGAALLGLFVTDTTPIDATTGLPTVAATGGAGFHIGITGNISFINNINGSITAAGTTLHTLGTMGASAQVFKWFDAGFRFKQIAAATTTYRLTAYFAPVGYKMRKVYDTTNFIDGNLSTTFAVVNGAANQTDLGIDSLVSGVTRRANWV